MRNLRSLLSVLILFAFKAPPAEAALLQHADLRDNDGAVGDCDQAQSPRERAVQALIEQKVYNEENARIYVHALSDRDVEKLNMILSVKDNGSLRDGKPQIIKVRGAMFVTD
jgi:hypothetical protein